MRHFFFLLAMACGATSLANDGLIAPVSFEANGNLEPACAAEPVCCSASDCCCEKDYLFGLIAPTSLCHSDYISPMTNPVYFEDPRTLTEVRFIFAHHALPGTAPLSGGSIQLLAAQVRVALNERTSIIANKDGYF